MIAPAKRSVMDTPIRGPMTTNMILGGMSMPIVPPAAIAPAPILVSYLLFLMAGSAMTHRRVMDEPTIPVAAAKIVAVKIIAIYRDPGIGAISF